MCNLKSKTINGFTLLELLIVVLILGILALIGSFVLLDAAEKSKMAAVRANVSAAASTVTYKLTVDTVANDQLITAVVEKLNDPDQEPDTGDENHSPFLKTVDAFTDEEEAEAGQVTIIAESDIVVYIKGYGKQGSNSPPIISKVASTLSSESSGTSEP